MTNLLVFTDLDGTLLDHYDYSYAAALPSIKRLSAAGCPLIFNSSKTAEEISPLRNELDNCHPFIVENGSAVCIPSGYFNGDGNPGACIAGGYDTHSFGPRYHELLAQLHELRTNSGYRFRGFFDLSDEEIAKLTGLSAPSATKARQRSASEPLIWDDSKEALENFQKDLESLQLGLTRGGRFYHVMGQTDKSRALQWLVDKYHKAWPDRQWKTVALGDGPNDLSMLEVADIAVIIPPADGGTLKLIRTSNVIRPDLPGPRGWQSAMDIILKRSTTKGV